MSENSRWFLRLFFCLVLAFGFGWYTARYLVRPSAISNPPPAGEAPEATADSPPSGGGRPVKTIGADSPGMREFLAAVKAGDFEAMRKLGGELFPKGAAVPDARRLFPGYEANNIPPYRVFAFLSDQGREQARRVMLTLDGENRVESFMAEEMPVVK